MPIINKCTNIDQLPADILGKIVFHLMESKKKSTVNNLCLTSKTMYDKIKSTSFFKLSKLADDNENELEKHGEPGRSASNHGVNVSAAIAIVLALSAVIAALLWRAAEKAAKNSNSVSSYDLFKSYGIPMLLSFSALLILGEMENHHMVTNFFARRRQQSITTEVTQRSTETEEKLKSIRATMQ